MRRVFWVAAACAVAFAGCNTFATHSDYAAYRAVRLAQNDDERLAAMAHYIATNPNGMWAGEIRHEHEVREQGVWLSNNSTQAGLTRYLDLYPEGQFADQARARMTAVTHVEEHREVEQTHVVEVSREDAAAAAEERRHWVTRATQFWTRTLLGITNYGQPISQVARANPDFSAAFGQPPAPMCTPAHCLKHYHGHFAIPVPGATRIERDMNMFLRIRLDGGRMERVEVLLPNMGFSRWYELENRTLVTDEDPEQRQQAMLWALDQLMPTITEAAPGSRSVDVIPDPIESITASETAETATAEEDEEPAPAPTPSATPSSTSDAEAAESGDASLEELLTRAAGPEESTETAQVEIAPADGGEIVLPIGLHAIQRGSVRFVVFAAGEGDYGNGFDGFYIERARD
jgi:hypothetical protein